MRKRLIAIVLSVASSTASAQVWTHEYLVGEDASQITSCNAGIVFADGAVIVRIYGEVMDMFFYHESLSVPPSTELGNVALSFKADTFVATAFSTSSETSYTSSMLGFKFEVRRLI